MGILDEDVARVREATDLVALASEHIALKRVGRRFSGLCPFHSEKSPSFSISPEKQVSTASGARRAATRSRSSARSSISTSSRRSSGSPAAPASRFATTTPRSRDGPQAQAAAARSGRRGDRLLPPARCSSRDAPARARRYLRSRGFDGDVARRFSLGLAPDGYDALSRHLQKQEVLARRHRRRRARVREQGEQAAGPVPRPVDVPDLGRAG